MKVVFLTYCTKEYYKSAKCLIKSAKKFGLHDISFYTRDDLIKTDFYTQNKRILELPQRAGCSLWKIYYIHHEYFKINKGDILFYADAGSKFINNPKPLIELCKTKGIVLFNLNNKPLEKHWTKRDTFVLMNCDEEKYHNHEHINAAFQIYQRNDFNDNFINELFTFGQDIRIIADLPNVCGLPNLEGFREHRFDQSILSILSCKYNIEIFRYPAQWGNHFKTPDFRKKNEWLAEPYSDHPMINSPYFTILDHHRKKNFSFKNVFNKNNILKNYYLLKHHIKILCIKLKIISQ